LLGLLTIWLVISVYFYFQHRVMVQVMKVPAWSLDDPANQGVLVKEIKVYRWEPQGDNFDSYDRWWPVLEFANKLPRSIRRKYSDFVGSVLYFYTDPYHKLEDGARRVEIIGYILQGAPGGLENFNHPAIRVYSGEDLIAGVSSEFGAQHSGDSNFLLFEMGDKIYSSVKDSIKLTWQWDNGPTVTKSIINSRFEIKTYSFFNRPPRRYSNLRPVRKAYELINVYGAGKKEMVTSLVSTKVSEFPWHYIDWVKQQENYVSYAEANYYGKYKGFENVFTVDLSFARNAQEMDAGKGYEQKVFLVDEDDGWKIVDVSPYK